MLCENGAWCISKNYRPISAYPVRTGCHGSILFVISGSIHFAISQICVCPDTSLHHDSGGVFYKIACNRDYVVNRLV